MISREDYGCIRMCKNLVVIPLNKFLGVWFDRKDESLLILTSVTVTEKIYDEYFKNDVIKFQGEEITLFISISTKYGERHICTVDSYTNSDDGIKTYLNNPFEIKISNIYITR